MAANLPCGRDEDAAPSVNSRIVIGVIFVLRGLSRDSGDVHREIDGVLLVRSDSNDVEDEALSASHARQRKRCRGANQISHATITIATTIAQTVHLMNHTT